MTECQTMFFYVKIIQSVSERRRREEQNFGNAYSIN